MGVPLCRLSACASLVVYWIFAWHGTDVSYCWCQNCLLQPNTALISWVCFKVATYSFLTALELISKFLRWRELSNSTPKSRVESFSKMPTNMASKFLKFIYRKCCVDRLRFQNIYRLKRAPYLSPAAGFKGDMYEVCRNHMKLICSIATIIE